MRTPIDLDLDDAGTPTEDAARGSADGTPRPPLVGPPNGKAWERLLLFEQERGLVEPDTEPPDTLTEAVRALDDDPMQTRSDLTVDYAEALEATELDTERARGAAPPSWRPLGPTFMRNGQTYGSGAGSRVDVSGRVSSIAVDPSNSAHLLAGAAGGGVWESRDGGTTWIPRGDALSTLTVGALAFDPVTPTTAYLGSGEGDFYAGLGQGVFRSTNGGTTWTLAAGAPFIGAGFHTLVVDPSDQATLYAATTIGVYTSSDGGTTWTRRQSARAWSVSVHPSGGDTEVLATTQAGLVRSTDRGVTWNAVALTGVPNPPNYSRLSVSHAPSNGGVAWAWGASAPPMPLGMGTQPTPRLWRRATATGAFTSIATDAAVRTGQSWYDWYVQGDPTSDASVYVGEINLFRVDRQGRTWVWTNLSSKVNADSIHPDQHCLTYDPANGEVIYAGCDGGVVPLPDRGATLG